MILGTGVDVVDIASFAAQLAEPGTRFEKVFTARERRAAHERAARRGGSEGAVAEHLAARWAAKEAFVKAWSAALYGSAPPLPETVWSQIEVVGDQWDRPGLRLYGAVEEKFAALGETRLHLSLSHDGPVAVAFVVVDGSA
ncbi:holo-ACP synthase [Actinobaculum sp. 313]|uniref:holo-ACP synthase AcpS n=1 Tax=Actinobaculum sp. 313 TaxID=2495645 RepID=UPI000D525F91|nr:holo-ACP synthase [Actinobaculum sp. 313]AWE42127.1 holo-ACP synthase [Actinobaculum sp. 313]